jgi:N4-(beta-N-acetylglucosaminyl)-L-asparaginase
MWTRRHWMVGTASLAAASQAASQTRSGGAKNIVISSGNGLRACSKAMEMLKGGADTLDAVVAGVNINEEDPEDDSVGYGGLPNEEGVVELDACVMHGPTRRAGSVAGIHGIKTPSKIARLVMEQSDHIMLVAEGALRFAKAYGFKEENLLTEKSRLAWLTWKKSQRDAGGHSNWTDGLDAPPSKTTGELRRLFPDATDELLAYAWDRAINRSSELASTLIRTPELRDPRAVARKTSASLEHTPSLRTCVMGCLRRKRAWMR